MRSTHFLYGVVILVVVGIFAYSTGYITDTQPIDTSRQQEYETKPIQTVKNRSCPCCAEEEKRRREMLRQWLDENSQENSKRVSSDLR